MILANELKEKLKQSESDINAINEFWNTADIEKKYQEIHLEFHKEDFWKHPQRDQISAEHSRLKLLVKRYKECTESFNECSDLIDLFADNEAELAEIKVDIGKLCKKITALKVDLLLNDPQDKQPCYISINAGAGGTESQDWANMLLRMYLRFCEQESLGAQILDIQNGEEAGIKSATLYIKHKHAAGLLSSEVGIHRLVRISPFDSNKRRHTSFAAVSITAEREDISIQIDDKDLRIDTYRAGGAGGQHVNKTDSAVRITHIPSGIVVQCQNERSQLQNRQTALKMLKSKLIAKEEEARRQEDASIEKKKIEWGSQIRSYVLHPYKMVKDHRTGHESPQPEVVLDGNLIKFIEQFLVFRAKK